MPEITLKNHHKALPEGDLRDDGYISQGEKEIVLSSGLLVKYEHFYKVDGSLGFLNITSNGKSIGLLNYKSIKTIAHNSKVAQVSSVYVKPDFQNQGVGPNAYEFLISQLPVVSDNLQTEAGATLWAIKLASNPKIRLNIIDCFRGEGERVRVDHEQQAIEYTYGDVNVKTSTIWGISNFDPRIDLDIEFEPSFESANDDVVLIATPKDT